MAQTIGINKDLFFSGIDSLWTHTRGCLVVMRPLKVDIHQVEWFDHNAARDESLDFNPKFTAKRLRMIGHLVDVLESLFVGEGLETFVVDRAVKLEGILST